MATEATIVTTLLAQLVLDLEDATVPDELYEHILRKTAPAGFNTYAYALQTTAALSGYQYDGATNLVNIDKVFFDTTPIQRATNEELEAESATWILGDTLAAPYVGLFREAEVVVYPAPVAGSGAVSGTFATAFGAGFVANQLSLIGDTSETTVLDQLSLPIALAIVADEFSRNSNHQDVEYAATAMELYNLFLALISHQRSESLI